MTPRPHLTLGKDPVSNGQEAGWASGLLILLLLLSAGLPVANAPDVLQPCGLLYYPQMFQLSPPVVSPRDSGSQRWSYVYKPSLF